MYEVISSHTVNKRCFCDIYSRSLSFIQTIIKEIRYVCNKFIKDKRSKRELLLIILVEKSAVSFCANYAYSSPRLIVNSVIPSCRVGYIRITIQGNSRSVNHIDAYGTADGHKSHPLITRKEEKKNEKIPSICYAQPRFACYRSTLNPRRIALRCTCWCNQ